MYVYEQISKGIPVAKGEVTEGNRAVVEIPAGEEIGMYTIHRSDGRELKRSKLATIGPFAQGATTFTINISYTLIESGSRCE